MYSLDILKRVHGAEGHHMHKEPHRVTMEEVHLNPEEVHELDAMQGGARFTADGKRKYDKLPHFLEHPMIDEAFHHHVEEHKANGGIIGRHMHPSAKFGRYGDTEMVLMPHRLTKYLDHKIGGPCYNPWDGKKEYFLGGLFGSFASKLLPSIGRGLSSIGSKLFGSATRSALSSGLSRAGSALASGASKIGSSIGRALPTVGRGLGQAANHAATFASHALPAVMDYQAARHQQQLDNRQQALAERQYADQQGMQSPMMGVGSSYPNFAHNERFPSNAGYASDEDEFHDARGPGGGIYR